MPRSPRVIVKGKLYELVSRAREGLPLPPTRTTSTLLKGILARTQRDEKVTLCNFVWMSNHSHIHSIPEKAEYLPRFYGEVQKKITDAIKTITGRRSLNLWEDRTTLIMLEGLEDCVNRLVYIFCNPTKAGLVDSIDEYPGLSTWNAFTTCEAKVSAEVTVNAPWHPVATLPRLSSSSVSLSRREDNTLSGQLCSSKASVAHKLVIKPFAWLEQYGVTESSEIEEIRKEVIQRVRELEAEYREGRRNERRSAMGAERLQREPYLKPHKPKTKERKIHLICSDNTRRVELLLFFQSIFDQCRECYQSIKDGIAAEWPPGTFVPWVPPKICYSFEEC